MWLGFVRVVLHELCDTFGHLFLIKAVAGQDELGIAFVEQLPFVKQPGKGLVGSLGDTPGGKIANAAFDFGKRDFKEDDG